MDKSTNSTNYNNNLGGITMWSAYLKYRDLLRLYRRKPLYLSRNSFNNDLYHFLILYKRI
jgi:hypothetical protein